MALTLRGEHASSKTDPDAVLYSNKVGCSRKWRAGNQGTPWTLRGQQRLKRCACRPPGSACWRPGRLGLECQKLALVNARDGVIPRASTHRCREYIPGATRSRVMAKLPAHPVGWQGNGSPEVGPFVRDQRAVHAGLFSNVDSLLWGVDGALRALQMFASGQEGCGRTPHGVRGAPGLVVVADYWVSSVGAEPDSWNIRGW